MCTNGKTTSINYCILGSERRDECYLAAIHPGGGPICRYRGYPESEELLLDRTFFTFPKKTTTGLEKPGLFMRGIPLAYIIAMI